MGHSYERKQHSSSYPNATPYNLLPQLPYGTMTDDEMRAMPIPTLQDEGLLFLWVTGRAMEVGRECLRVWGYTRVDEVVWVKTNQVISCSSPSTYRLHTLHV
jgi:N6-adenosine-specific RNA methylase IME4